MNYEEPQQQPHQPLFYSPLPFLSPDVATASLSGSPALNTPAASTAHGMHPSPVQHTNTNTALNQMSWQMHKNDFDLLMDPALYFDGNPISVLLDKSRAVPEATSYQSEQVFNLDSLNTHYQQPLDFGAYTPETTVSGADLMSMQGSPAINIPASNDNDTPMIPQHQQLTFYSGGGVFENDNAQTETPYLEEHVFSSTGNYYHHDNNAQQHDTSSLFPPLPSDETEFIEDKRVRGKVKEEQAEEDQEKEDQEEEEEEEEEFQETRRAKKPRRKSPKFHPCPECHRTFDRKYNMTTHLRTHDKARKKPFQCRVGCKKAFDRKHDRERHEASVHRQERLYTCGRCSASFARRDALSKHEDMCC